MRYAGDRPLDRCPDCGGRIVPGQPERPEGPDGGRVVRQPGRCERCGAKVKRLGRLRYSEWRKAG